MLSSYIGQFYLKRSPGQDPAKTNHDLLDFVFLFVRLFDFLHHSRVIIQCEANTIGSNSLNMQESKDF